MWNSNLGMAEFRPGSSSSTSVTSTPTSSGVGAVSNQNFLTSNQNGKPSGTIRVQDKDEQKDQSPYYAPPSFFYQPPVAPNVKPLQRLQNRVVSNNNKQIAAAMEEYDALAASTQASGFQSASNAANAYTNRLMQAGINPIASGVVQAQARLPIYNQLSQINSEKSRVRLDAAGRADALAAQIADKISSLQMAYTSQLAQYNQATAAYQLDLNKFNAGQSTRLLENDRAYEMQQKQLELQAAQLASAGSRNGGGRAGASVDPAMTGFNPGYIGSFGTLQPGTVNGSPIAGQRTAWVGWPSSWTA